MNNPPVQAVAVPVFKGQLSDIDSGDVPEGYMLQQHNLMSIKNGQLTTRGGLKEIILDTLE